MRFGRYLASIALASLASACSWITTFAVINGSSAPIVVSYAIASDSPKAPPCPDDNFVEIPRVVPVKDVETLKGLRNEAPPAAFTCDKARRTVSLSLEPGHAVSLFKVGTYTGPDSERDYYLDIGTLTIKGETGEVQYSGRQLLRDFEEKDRTLWLLTYK